MGVGIWTGTYISTLQRKAKESRKEVPIIGESATNFVESTEERKANVDTGYGENQWRKEIR